MTGPTQWRTTVTELLLILRDALAALVPVVERAKMGWRDAEAYDDWDDICQSLYKNIVIRSLEYSLGSGEPLSIPVPDYGTVYPTYARKNFFRVLSDVLSSNVRAAFVGFSTVHDPLDHVAYVALSDDFAAADDVERIPIEGVGFEFLRRKSLGRRDSVTSIVVEL